MAFDAGSIESRLTLDRTPFSRGLTEARTEAARFASSRPSVALSLVLTSFFAASRAARAELAALSALTPAVTLGMNAAGFFSTARVARSTAADLDQTDATVTIRAADQASGEIRSVERLFSSLSGRVGVLTLNANDQASPKIVAAERLLSNFAGRNATATADINTGSAQGKATVLDSALDEIDGRRVSATADVDASNGIAATQGLDRSLDALNQRVGLTRGGLLAIGAVIAGAVPAVLALGAAVTTLGAGFGLVAAAALPTIRALSEHKTASEGLKTSQEQASQAVRAHEDAERSLSETLRQGAQAEAQAREQIEERVQALADTRRRAAQEESQAASQIAEMERSLASQRAQNAEAAVAENQQIADARQNLADIQRAARLQEEEDLQALADAEENLLDVQRRNAESVAAVQERARAASDRVADAEADLIARREELEAATADLVEVQGDYNEMLATEAERIAVMNNDLEGMRINQEQTALDLANAEQELGRLRREGTPEEIYAQELRVAEIRNRLESGGYRLAEMERKIAEAREEGTDELQRSKEAVEGAYDAQRRAAEGVSDQEEQIALLREEAAKAQREISVVVSEALRQESAARQDIVDLQRDAALRTQENAFREERAQEAITRAIASAAAQQERANEQIYSQELRLQEARERAAIQADENNRDIISAQEDVAQSVDRLRITQEDNAAKSEEAQRRLAEAAEKVASAQDEVAEKAEETGAVLTASQAALLAAWERFSPAFTRAMAPASAVLEQLGADVLYQAETLLPLLGYGALQAATGFAGGIRAIMNSLTVPEQLTIFERFFSEVTPLMENMTFAVGALGLGLVNFLLPGVDVANDLAQGFRDVFGAFLAWSQSTEGQQQIIDFWQTLKPLVPPLVGLFETFGQVLWQMLQDGSLQRFAYNLLVLTDTIVQNLPAILPFFDLLSSAIETFHSLPQPVQNAAIQFAALNLALGGAPLALLGGLVGGLRTFLLVAGAMKVLGLPSLWSLVFGGLGSSLSGLVGVLGSAGAAVWTFFTVTLPGAVGAGLGPIAAVLATLLGSWYYILGPAGLIVGALLGLAAFVAGGWVLLVVAAVASAFAAIGVALYRNWDTVYPAIIRGIEWFRGLPGWAREALVAALAGIPILGPLLENVNSTDTLFSGGYVGGGIRGWFAGLPASAQSAFTTAVGGLPLLGPLVENVSATAQWFANGGPGGIVEWFSSLPGWAQSAIYNAISGMPVLGPLIDSVISGIEWFTGGGAESGIVSWFGSLPGWVLSALGRAISSSPIFGPIVTSVQSIFEWLNGLGDSWESVAKNFVIGLIRGLYDMAPDWLKSVVDIVKSGLEAAWNLIDPGSPSRTGRRMTENLLEGMISGAYGMAPLLSSALGDAVGGALGSVDGDMELGRVNVASSGGDPSRISRLKEPYARRRRSPSSPTLSVTLKVGDREFKAAVVDAVWENAENGLRGSGLGLGGL